MDKLAHFFAGVSLSMSLGVFGVRPGATALTVFVTGAAREGLQHPRNAPREQMQDFGATLAGGLVGGYLIYHHLREDQESRNRVTMKVLEAMKRMAPPADTVKPKGKIA